MEDSAVTHGKRVSALVLAAGRSTRMGRPKQFLRIGDQTIIEKIVRELLRCPLHEILVVTGHLSSELETHLAPLSVRTVFNPHFRETEMLGSIQVGLRALENSSKAALIVLGDQPSISDDTVKDLIRAYERSECTIAVPSHRGRRGHPVLIDRTHWSSILDLGHGESLRDFMAGAAREAIHHLEVDTPHILRDIDTPTDYQEEIAREG